MLPPSSAWPRFFFNRTDSVPFLAPWGSPCRAEAGGRIDALLRAHLLGDAAPAVEVRWVTKENKAGDEVGRFRIGTYAPDTRGKTRWGCVDFDGAEKHSSPLADPLGAALLFLAACERLSLPAYLECSGGGKGWHVRVFFAGPVPAQKVRTLLFALIPSQARLTDGMPADAKGNRGIEVFPKQDSVSEDGFGNMVWLPWWHGAAEGGNIFYRVDAGGELAPYPPEVSEVSDAI
jgi:hypothetical protein